MNFFKGDCLEVMKSLPAKSIDCFICDLPYGCLSGRAKKCFSDDAMGCDWDIPIDLKKFWEQVKRLAKDDHTPVLMFCTTKFGADLINSNPDWFRYDLVWDKLRGVSFLSANKMPLRSHEMIYVFSKKGAYYKRVDISVEGAKEWKQFGKPKTAGCYSLVRENEVIQPIGTITSKEGIRCVKSVIEIPTKSVRAKHPTQKPAELYKWLLERYCPENGTMLDPTAGSFNSCFTAKSMGLRAIGIEKDSNYFWKAVALSNVPAV